MKTQGNATAHAACVLVARTIMRLGGSASVQRLAQELQVPAQKIRHRLVTSSGVDKTYMPEWCYFGRNGTTDEWGLTGAGFELATGAEPDSTASAVFGISRQWDAVADAVDRAASSHRKLVSVQCPNCLEHRQVNRHHAAKTRSEGKPLTCPKCAKKPAEERVPDLPGVVMGCPRLPTKARPGSPMKAAILAERYALFLTGQWTGTLHLAGDAGAAIGRTRFEQMLEEAA